MKVFSPAPLVLLGLVLLCCSCREPAEPAPPALPIPLQEALSPEASLETFTIAPGYRVELVAAEPLVEAPVGLAFGEDGQLWVVEMRGFMPDVEGSGEDEPTGRIAVLRDTDGDGRMDARTTFLDSLVLPRTVSPSRGGAFVADAQQLYFARDADADGRADVFRVVDADYAPGGNPEHDPNGMVRALDNWFYNAKSRARYRWVGDDLVKDETEFRGQWGLTQDDFGRLFYNYNFSQLHADLVAPNYLSRNPHHKPTSGLDVSLVTSQRIFPIRDTPAVNRGYIPGALDEQGRLQEFTSACSPLVYRGTALPEEAYGDAFVCEPATNLIARNRVQGEGLDLTAAPAYEDRDFLASTDERFRPVALAHGPDGALYVADMYRGLVQHKIALTPYLREQTLDRGLEAPLNHGRIWRIVADGSETPPPVADRLSAASPAELVVLLADPNGWRRDTAQRLLVERAAAEAIPALLAMALTHADPLARLHALWTLEGLRLPSPETLLPALDDGHPQVQSTAIRVLESLAEDDTALQQQLARKLHDLAAHAPPEVQLQAALTAGNLPDENRAALLHRVLNARIEQPLFRDAVLSSLQAPEVLPFLERLVVDSTWTTENQHRAIFLETLAGLILQYRQPDEVEALLALLGPTTETPAWQQRALLSGLSVFTLQPTFDPVELPTRPAVFDRPPAGRERQVARLEQIFAWPGHTPRPQTTASEAPPLDAQQAQLFARGRQVHLSVCASCHGTEGEGLKPLAPPLVASEWVLGSDERLIRMLLHGISGPIEVAGTTYEPPNVLPEMPPFRTLDDADIAAVLTYLRRAWGHTAAPVSPRDVGRLRVFTQGRTVPWTAEELLQIEEEAE